MKSCMLLFLTMVPLLSGQVARVHANRRWGKSPLPVFTSVEAEHNNDRNSSSLRVFYKANQRPDHQWFVDDIPFEGGIGDYFLLNTYDGYMLCMTTIIVPDSVGTRFAVCLQTPDGQNCLHFRPDLFSGFFDEQNEDVDFPWPLLVPAPRARYDTGKKARIFAYDLDNYNYNYTGRFIYRDPAEQADQSQSQILHQAEASTGSVGGAGDVISIARVTSGSPGWVLEMATDARGLEGVLMFRTTIEPPQWASATVARSVSTRPVNIYNRAHLNGPFPDNFVAMLPHSGDAISVACRPQSNLVCLIACPFAINGDIRDVELSFSRVVDSDGGAGSEVHMPRTSLFGLVRKTGKYLGEARFTLNVSDDAEPGLYRCFVSLAGRTTSTLVRLTIV